MQLKCILSTLIHSTDTNCFVLFLTHQCSSGLVYSLFCVIISMDMQERLYGNKERTTLITPFVTMQYSRTNGLKPQMGTTNT